MIRDVSVGACLLFGTLFCILAGLGLVRMPDFYSRLQTTTKATTLGAGLVMLAVAIHFDGGPAVTRAVAIILFMLVTAPVSGQMLSRAAYLMGVPLWKNTLSDSLKGEYAKKNPLADPAVNESDEHCV